MPKFTCTKCGKPVDGDGASVNERMLCQACNAASSVATPADAAKAKVARPGSRDGAYSEGLPPIGPAPRRYGDGPPSSLPKGLLLVVAVVLSLIGCFSFAVYACF